MFEFSIFILVIITFSLYFSGIRMSRYLENNEMSLLEKYGSPNFLTYGANEYRFIIMFIIFGDYKHKISDVNGVRYCSVFRALLFIEIISLIFFLIALVN